SSNTFNQYVHDPLQSMSPATNFTTFLYQDKDGFIWTGTEGYGAEFFNPDKNLFQSIQQSLNQSPTLPDNWCRTAAEDQDGNLWLGTASGLARYDIKQKTFRIFQNIAGKPLVLHANSIRSLLCDGDDLWIGANGGVNRYHISSGKMDFLGAKDSLPNSFYWAIIKDHTGDIWFGCRDGLYRYNQKTKKIDNFNVITALAPYSREHVRSLFEDSHHRLWIGLYFYGLVMYDPSNGQVKHFTSKENNEGPGSGIITSINEDKKGLIWVGSSSGLSAYNSTTNSFKHYLSSETGASEITSSLVCDDENRLWIAASSGLYMLDSSRRSFKNFGRNEGLPTIDFNSQSACRMRNGTLVYPTMKGFIVFNPKHYQTKNDNADVHITLFRILDKEYKAPNSLEQTDSIHLGYDQNFFSIQMTAVNYDNPNQNWYAHKLDPFDKDWIYTEERIVNYTNVTGGDYTFRYKTSTDRNNWQVPEKILMLHIDTVFYKTWWFRALALLTSIGMVFWIYRISIRQKEKVLMLEKKAFLLEKEKALVMYESLKQQLNPHFLFNSLTSLSSLISSNPTHAKRFLDSLSKIYRYILKSRDSETVSLDHEIKLAEIYLQLQQTRFKDGLQWTIDIPEDRLHLRIAPVTLQNLVENAIKHNIIDPASPLMILISEENGWLVVQNNLQKKTFVESSNRQGLVNMESLYNYITGKKIITLQDENHFIIKVPLI
ncbi:MAG: two-component regulator propeller domain-containing protein, partial [Flavitalea sp.]